MFIVLDVVRQVYLEGVMAEHEQNLVCKMHKFGSRGWRDWCSIEGNQRISKGFYVDR